VSRKRTFDSFVERALESGILEGEERWKRFVKEYLSKSERDESQDVEVLKKKLFEELKKLFVVRVRKNFERVVEDFEKGLVWLKGLLNDVLKCRSKGSEVYVLNFLEEIPRALGQALEETSDLAYHLFVVYQSARESVEKGKKNENYVKKVMKNYAEGFFEKLYVSVESVARFCELLERFYDEVEKAKKCVRQSGNGGIELEEDAKSVKFFLRNVSVVLKDFENHVETSSLQKSVMHEFAKNLVALLPSLTSKINFQESEVPKVSKEERKKELGNEKRDDKKRERVRMR